MHTGIFQITIETFRCVGAVVPIYATFKRDPKSDKAITLVGDDINITLPKSDREGIELIFKLQQPLYLLLGIAFANGKDGMGEKEFPYVELKPAPLPRHKRGGTYRMMTVRDAARQEANKYRYNFILLVQNVKTGEMGIIDPGIETKDEE